MRSPSDRTPADYAALWVRGLPVIAAATLGAVVAGLVAFVFLPHSYESQARLLVTATGPATVSAAQASDLAGRLRISSYSDLAVSDQVLGRTRLADATGALGGADIATLRSRITVLPYGDGAVLTVVAKGPTADAAQTLARGVGTNLAGLVTELEWSRTDGMPQYDAEVIDAGSSARSMSPGISTTLLTALVLGVVLSSVCVLGVGISRDVIEAPREAVVRVREPAMGADR
ncbi:polysaccharide biosynthesis protein [Gordonia sp. i37]|uniref:polysaccharide biosynthesis protein n=1 Tax=Gordonia sp. i37 TaxID=1961707 RepID=UPI0009AC90AF|nr:polysaccharide biosynthesis protein [Gordonia sp. i37]OPX07649.1 polysaccharide biosynthesis protein [Gordonia sp. i37]